MVSRPVFTNIERSVDCVVHRRRLSKVYFQCEKCSLSKVKFRNFSFEINFQCERGLMAYKVLHGRAPSDLGPRPLVHVDDVSCRRALRSDCTNHITVPPVRSTTSGSRAFSVAGPSLIWNSLPDDAISAESLPTFRRKLFDCVARFVASVTDIPHLRIGPP